MTDATTGSYQRILVIDLLGGLGDLLLVLPAVHALAQAHPDAALHVLTHEPGADLLRTDPAVRTVRTATRHAEADAVTAALAELGPDLVVSTTRHSGIPDLVAATGSRAVTDLWRQPPVDRRVDERYLDILRAEGLIGPDTPRPFVHLTEREQRAGAWEVGADASPVVLLPEAGMAVKEWPRSRWSELARELVVTGVPVFAVGQRRPIDIAGAEELPPGSLRSLAAQFAQVGRLGGVVVGPDTGPLRLAVATGARAVGLFGPTVRQRYGLPDDRAVNLQGLPGCPWRQPLAITEQPCWWHGDCPLSTDGPACLADLGVPAVAAAVLELLS